MKDEIISFETAKLGKEKGFDEPVVEVYDTFSGTLEETKRLSKFNHEEFLVSAPTQSLLQRWLREVHLININITSSSLESFTLCITSHSETESNLSFEDMKTSDHESYEEALEYGLQEALKLIKDA